MSQGHQPDHILDLPDDVLAQVLGALAQDW
jgi:hypothetical protein